MATLKSVSRSKRSESLRGSFMVDTVRGVIRIRKWPRKRGTPKSALQRWWIDWFKQANYLAKYVDGETAARAIEITAGSGMYPRDVILSAMRGRLYSWYDQTGKVWHSMAGIQDVSDSLDFIGQSVGDVLVRATDRWRKPDPSSPGDVLTARAAPLAPHWAAPAGGGGFSPACLVNMTSHPTIPNGAWTAVQYNAETYDLGAYHDPVTNNTRITMVAASGYVELTAWVGWASRAGGERIVEFRKNGSAFAGGGRIRDSYSHSIVGQNPRSAAVPFVVGDYFETVVYQSSGVAIGFEGPTIINSFAAKVMI